MLLHTSSTTTPADDDGSWRETDRRLRALVPRRAALDAEEAELIELAEKQRIHLHTGCISILEYLEGVLTYRPRTLIDRRRIAKRLANLPEIAKALAGKQIALSAVRELARVATSETEAAWLAAAMGKPLREIEELVTGHRQGSLPDDVRGEDIHPRPVTLELSPQTLALQREVSKTLDAEYNEHLSDDDLHATCYRIVLGGGAEQSNRPTHQIATTVCERCDRAWHDGAGARIEIGPAALALSRCDAEHLGSLDAEVPDRASADVTPAVRRLVHRRDHDACRVSWCRSKRFLDIHHIVPRAAGGSHKPSNLCLLCTAHHTQLHEGRLSITGTSKNLVVERVTYRAIAAELLDSAVGHPRSSAVGHPRDSTVGHPRDKVAGDNPDLLDVSGEDLD